MNEKKNLLFLLLLKFFSSSCQCLGKRMGDERRMLIQPGFEKAAKRKIWRKVERNLGQHKFCRIFAAAAHSILKGIKVSKHATRFCSFQLSLNRSTLSKSHSL